MSEVLILRLDLDPEVEVYMDTEGVSLDKALKQLQLYPDEAVATELEIVDREDLSSYGVRGRDYILVKKINQLRKFEYELEDVLNTFNIDMKKLKQLDVLVDEYEEFEDD
jgi:hypothetical protein